MASKAMGKNVKEKKKVESFKRGRRGKKKGGGVVASFAFSK